MNDKFFDLKKEKQDRMINGALKIFAKEGYKRASTDDIVREAAISKGLLFHYFISKLGLYTFIYDYSAKYMQFELSRAVDPEERDLFEIRKQVELAKVRVLKNYPYMQQFLNTAEFEEEPDALAETKEAREAYRERLRELDAQADRSAFLSEKEAKQIEAVMDYTIKGLLAEQFRRQSFDPDRFFETVCDHIQLLRRLR